MSPSYLSIRDFAGDFGRDQPPGEVLESGKRYKLDLETPLEGLLNRGILVGALLSLLAMLGHFRENLVLGGLLWPAIALVVGSLICRRACDNFYVLDLPRRAMMYRFKFFLFERNTELAPIDRLLAVAVDGRAVTRRRILYWGYQDRDLTYSFAMVLLLRDGRVFPVSDYVENDFAGVEQSARRLAAAFGIPFQPGKLRGQVLTISTPEGPRTVRPVFSGGFRDWGLLYLALLVVGLLLVGVLR